MFFGGGLLGLAVLALWIFCIFDVIATDDALARNLSKIVWLLIVIFIPTVGAIAWLLLGRPEKAGWRPGDTESRPMKAIGPEDSPEFMSRLDDETERLRRWEEDLRRRERELRHRDEDRPD